MSLRFFNVTLAFSVSGMRVQPLIKHIPALDAEDAERKALATSTATTARARGAVVTVVSVQESER